jgi:hypothetical protein
MAAPKQRYTIEQMRVRFGLRRADDSCDDTLIRIEENVWRRLSYIVDKDSRRFWQTYVGMIEDEARKRNA